eukprot:scaffold218487_cov21-Tisochrysis_lutea.AAC.1
MRHLSVMHASFQRCSQHTSPSLGTRACRSKDLQPGTPVREQQQQQQQPTLFVSIRDPAWYTSSKQWHILILGSTPGAPVGGSCFKEDKDGQ